MENPLEDDPVVLRAVLNGDVPPDVLRVYGDLRHHIAPAIGWVRLADRDGDPEAVEKAMRDLDERFMRAADNVISYFDRKEN